MPVARLRGLEIAYDDIGGGAPLVLLHGYPFNRSMWREQAEHLRGDYRVITPDLRGQGESAAPEGSASMDEMARDVAALLDELQIEETVLGGLSMGGYVALSFYRLFKERVRALILADTRPQGDTDEVKRGREEQARKILKEGMQAIADGFLKKALAPATLSGKPETVERVREMILKTDPQGAAAALGGMAARADHTELLPEITVPTLALVGREDGVTPPEEAERMCGAIRGARLEIIEGASHLSNLERPAEFNLALKDFLDALPLRRV